LTQKKALMSEMTISIDEMTVKRDKKNFKAKAGN